MAVLAVLLLASLAPAPALAAAAPAAASSGASSSSSCDGNDGDCEHLATRVSLLQRALDLGGEPRPRPQLLAATEEEILQKNFRQSEVNGVKVIIHQKSIDQAMADDSGAEEGSISGGTALTWVISSPNGCGDSDLNILSVDMPMGMPALYRSGVSEAGLCLLVVKGTPEALTEELETHDFPPGTIAESDFQWGLVDPVEDGEEQEEEDYGGAQWEPPLMVGAEQANPPSWGLDRVDGRKGLDQAFNPPLTGKGANVYVLDTGVRLTHADFGGRAIPVLDATSGQLRLCDASDTACASDDHGHGTHCAGTVGGSSYGVAKEATIYSCKVLDSLGRGSWSWFVMAANWVISNAKHPAIISASVGGPGRISTLGQAINKATAAGISVVVAAGNEATDACNRSPAYAPSAITVAATQTGDGRPWWSNYGSCVDLFAPGRLIVSAGSASDTSQRTMSGTSMACPHVSGAMALLRAANLSLTPAEAVKLLKDDATLDAVIDPGTNSPNLFLYAGQGMQLR